MKKKRPMTASEMGKKGGASRAKKLTEEERRESAKRAAEARWGKKNADEKQKR